MIIVSRHGNIALFGGVFVSSSEKRATIVGIGCLDIVASPRGILVAFPRLYGGIKKDSQGRIVPYFALTFPLDRHIHRHQRLLQVIFGNGIG